MRKSGWQGYWIDAASALRMDKDAVIILDPVNLPVIQRALADGRKDFIGGNCTVSLMLMALGGLFNADLVEWATSMTYQAASGAGAKNMRELLGQMGVLQKRFRICSQTRIGDPRYRSQGDADAARCPNTRPKLRCRWPAYHLIPWIDVALENGQSKGGMKGGAETNKILGRSENWYRSTGPVRIGAMRCHSQALTIQAQEECADG